MDLKAAAVGARCAAAKAEGSVFCSRICPLEENVGFALGLNFFTVCFFFLINPLDHPVPVL